MFSMVEIYFQTSFKVHNSTEAEFKKTIAIGAGKQIINVGSILDEIASPKQAIQQ